jgi:Flp pilus assembly protein TadB
MDIVFWTALVFAGLILVIFLFLRSLDDDQARLRIKTRFPRSETAEKSFRDDIYKILLESLDPPEILETLVSRQEILWADLNLTNDQFLSLWWLGIMSSSAGIGLLLIVPGASRMLKWMAIPCLAAGSSPYFFLKWKIRERRKIVSRELANFLDLLTFTVEAGLGLVPALERIKESHSGLLQQEIVLLLEHLRLGFTRREALEDFARRLPSGEVHNLIEAIQLSNQLGTSLSSTLRVQSKLLQTRRYQRAELQAQTAPIRIIPALVFFFLPGLLLIYLAPPIINFFLQR